MHRRKKLSLSFFLLVISYACCLSLRAQQKSRIPKNTILFAPLNAFDIVNPSLQLGYERMVSPKLALQVEAGYMLHHSIPNVVIDLASGVKVKDCPRTNKGYRLRAETKYFVLLKRKAGLYTSAEVFYMQNRSGVVETFKIADPGFPYPTPPEPDANAYDEFFYNTKKMYGVNLKFGFKLLPSTTGFVLEAYAGLGLAHRTNRHTGRMNKQDKPAYPSFLFDTAEGNRFRFNIPFNIKLGYRF